MTITYHTVIRIIRLSQVIEWRPKYPVTN